MKICNVRAVRWERGWELHIENEGVTQVRTLDKAARQVADYLETLHGHNIDTIVIAMHADVPGGELANTARQHAHDANELQTTASREMREAVAQLRNEGISVTDTAALLGISRGRVSQLADA